MNAIDYRAQHQPDGCEPFETPTEKAGERKRHMPAPIETYDRRGQLDARQVQAARNLYGWHSVGVLGASDRDPMLTIRRSSPMRALPDYQLDALQHYHNAIDAMPDECREVTLAVCCDDVAVSSMARGSGHKRTAFMGLLRRGLNAVADYDERA